MAPSESPEESAGRHESDLYVRPGWVDADVALRQVDQVRHNVNIRANLLLEEAAEIAGRLRRNQV